MSTGLQRDQVIGGDFRITEPLAEGGMGAVYVALQISTGKRRALKVMKPGLVTDSRSRERFVEEAKLGARIESEHVVEVIAAGVDEKLGVPWLAMELLDGTDLDEHIASHGPLSLLELSRLFEQLAHALGEAHSKGIIHRDLKPENLFLSRSKRVGGESVLKILDFGIAALISADKTAALVTTAIGSPLWIAPEQMNMGAELRPSTDVFALGLIAFYLITGKSYWRAANEEPFSLNPLITEIVVQPIVPASTRARELGSHVPAGFDGWFAACVVREPERRFQNATAACAALSSLAAASVASTVASPLVRGGTEPAKAPRSDGDPPAVAAARAKSRERAAASEAAAEAATRAALVSRPHAIDDAEPARVSPTRAMESAPFPHKTPHQDHRAVAPHEDGAAPRAAAGWRLMPVFIVLGGVAILFAGTAGLLLLDDDGGPHCPDGMVGVPATTFWMGSEPGVGDDDEHPRHEVTLTAYCIDRTEVTARAYAECVVAGGCSPRRTGPRCSAASQDHPANCVSWSSAAEYCSWRGARLPTEAEWEFAARGEDELIYPWGDEPPSANRLNMSVHGQDDGFPYTAPVGSFPDGASPSGALDMAGNAAEWVFDCFGDYSDHAASNPSGPAAGELRVVRGGCWSDVSAPSVRAAERVWYPATAQGDDVGFRCALTPAPQP